MTAVSKDAMAARLREAYTTGAVPPLRDGLAPDDADGAYAVQAINTRFWIDQGRTVVGRKVGLTSRAVQAQLGVDQPDFGVLFADMRIENGGRLPTGRALQPKVEAEVAFMLESDLSDADMNDEAAARAVAYATPALEIVDSRIAHWDITFADTVADNGSSAFFVLGADRRPLKDLDLWTCGMAMEIDGDVVSVGAGAACLGHPLKALAWLARTLARRGDPLRAGEIVLSGALGPMAAFQPRQQVRGTIGGLGSVSFTYGDPA